MEDERHLKIKKAFAIIILVVTVGLLCFIWYCLERGNSIEKPVSAEVKQPTEPIPTPTTSGEKYPRASVQNQYGIKAVQNLGGSNKETADRLLMAHDAIYVIGTTSSTNGDMAATSENVFVARLDYELNLLNCVTLKELTNSMIKDCIATNDGLLVLCETASITAIYKLTADLTALEKHTYAHKITRLYYSQHNELYAFSQTDEMIILRLNSQLTVLSKFFIPFTEQIKILAITTADNAINIIAADSKSTYLIDCNPNNYNRRTLPVIGAAQQFFCYQRSGENFYALTVDTTLYVLSYDYSLYNKAEIRGATSIVKNGNFLISITASPSNAEWLCACGCSVLTTEGINANISSVKSVIELDNTPIVVAQTQKPQEAKTFSFIGFDVLKTKTSSYIAKSDVDLILKGAITVDDSIVVLLESSANTHEFSGNKGAKDVFILKLEKPFA